MDDIEMYVWAVRIRGSDGGLEFVPCEANPPHDFGVEFNIGLDSGSDKRVGDVTGWHTGGYGSSPLHGPKCGNAYFPKGVRPDNVAILFAYEINKGHPIFEESFKDRLINYLEKNEPDFLRSYPDFYGELKRTKEDSILIALIEQNVFSITKKQKR